MAFVYREEFKSIFGNDGNKNIGPGYYLKKDVDEKPKEPNKVPFLVSSPRLKSANKHLNPGPGQYYSNNQFKHITDESSRAFNKFKKIEDQQKIEKADINNFYNAIENENIILESVENMEVYMDDQFEKLGFLSKNKRFKENFKADVPGPGAYLKNKPKSANILKMRKEHLKKSSLKNANKLQRETIPAKNHAFGFDYDERGNLVRNDDPMKHKRFRGDRANSVGPGYYQVVKPEDWKKKGTIIYNIDEKSKTQTNFFSKNTNKLNKEDFENGSYSPEIKKNLLNNTALKEKLNIDEKKILQKDGNFTKMASNTMMNFHSNSSLKKQENKKRCFSSLRSAFQRQRNAFKKEEGNATLEVNKIYDRKNFKEFSERLSKSFDLNDYNNVNNIQSETGMVLKFMKEKNKKLKEKQFNIHKNKLFDKSNLPRNKDKDIPGPGYYLEENNLTCFKNYGFAEYQQSFGSYQNRFPNCKTEDDIGPGAYFKEEFKLEKDRNKINKEKIMIPLMNKIKSYKPVKIEHNVNPGPGDYDPEKKKRRVQTAGANFGSMEPRFKKKEKALYPNNPGPGSYDQKENWIKLDSLKSNNNDINKILIKPVSANPIKLAQINAMKINELKSDANELKPIKQIYQTPGVGAYNLDTLFSLEYKVAKNCSKNSMALAPFNQTKSRPRFEPPKSSMGHPILGPGIYHKVEPKKLKQANPPFKSGEKRFKKSKSQYKTNPGQYDPSSYFDWNKKSFNILYL